MIKKQGFLVLLENLAIIFSDLVYNESLYHLHKSHNQIAGFLNQPYLLNKMIKKPVLFGYWYRVKEIKWWFKTVGMGMVKNGCDHSGLG